MDLPTEVLESEIFPYLTRKELKEIRLNKRLKNIADSVIEKMDRKGKYNLYSVLHGNCPISCIQIEICIHLFSETYILILGGDLRTTEDSKDEYRTQCGCYDFDSNVACDDCFDPESYPSPPLVSYFEIEEPFRLPSEIMKITFEEQTNRITSVECNVMPDYEWWKVRDHGGPRCFLNASFGNFNGRSLAMGGVGRFGRCFEFRQEPVLEDDPYQMFKNHFIDSKTKLRVEELPCLNKKRCGAASIFIQHKILILGGLDDDNGYKLDSIEILDLGDYNRGSK